MTNAERNRIVVKKYPWYRVYKRIMARCCKGGQYYGKIKVRIGVDELKKIWFRDKAWLLKKPSIDRIDSAKDYTFENCRFIELSDNQRWNGRPLKCIKCGKKHHALNLCRLHYLRDWVNKHREDVRKYQHKYSKEHKRS